MTRTVQLDAQSRLARSCDSADYIARVNRAIDHITRNLADPLNLDEVAKVAYFSPFHFHRIFRAIVGETVHDFVKRTRLERALHLMAHDTDRTLTDVALACGFSSSSDFSRSFRAYFGVSPRAFDLDVYRRERRRALVDTMPDGKRVEQLPGGINPDGFEVRLCDLPARRVAYLRVFRPYEGDGVLRATERLLAWARERRLEKGQWLGYQWENPELVPLDQCRYDVGLVIPDDVVVDGDVHETRFPPMKVAELEIAGGIDLELRALEWLFTTWLPRSGFAPDHQPCFGAWNGEPYAHGNEYFELRVHLAVT